MYKTTDTSLGAWLIMQGFDVEEFDRTDPKKVAFLFRDSIDIRGWIDVFQSGNPVGNILKYDSAKKMLIRKVYENV